MTRLTWNPAPRRPRIVVGALAHLPRSAVDVDRVRAELTVRNDAYFQALNVGAPTDGVEPVYELWTETETHLLVPRHYHLVSDLVDLPMVDVRRTSPRVRPLEHHITLRDETQEEASVALRRGFHDKIISLACGKGKTVISLHAASEGERFPLLIVVHTNALMDQWRENYDDDGELVGGIKKFYGLEDHEIGHIQARHEDWRGKKVAIAMLHSLVLKRYHLDFYRYWRLVIFDEVHRLGAHFFQQAASMFPGERWGLSATVEREDGMDHVFRLHLGEVAYEDLTQPLKPKVYIIQTGIGVDMERFMLRSGRVNTAKLYTHLSELPRRNARILKWIRKASKKGRTILILGERLSQLWEMYEQLKSEGFDSSVHVGSMSKEERREALRHKIVFATQHLAREGLDRPSFDTLVIAIPFGGSGRLRQSIGRILRLHSDKKEPLVLIFEDNIGIISALAQRMRRSLRRLGFRTKEIDVRKGHHGDHVSG